MTTALAIGATVAAKILYDRQVQIAGVNKNLKETAKVLYEGQVQIAAINKDLAKSEIKAHGKLFEAKASEARASRFSRHVGQRFGSLEALSEAVKVGRELGFQAERFDRLRDEAIASLMLPDLKPAGPPLTLPEANPGFCFDDGMTRYAFRLTDGTIVVRSFGDDKEILRIAAKSDSNIWLFLFSPDGKHLAFQDGDSISIWDVDRKSPVLTSHDPCVFWTGRFSPDNRRFVVGLSGGTILVYDLATGQSRRWSNESKGDAKVLTFRPDGTEIAVVSQRSPSDCRILDAETGRQLRAFSIPNCKFLAWNLDGSTLASVGMDNKITLGDASRFERGATLELPLSAIGGLHVAFHPAGTLLVSNGWESRLRLWDQASGRERLSITGGGHVLSKDGRIFLGEGGRYRAWQIEPAVEYTTLRHPSNQYLDHARVSIRKDGRILAVGTIRGVILWDLARRVVLAFLPIENAWHSTFEPSGDLLTNGDAGVLRWTIRNDPTSGEIRLGPPRMLPLVGSHCGIDADRTGQTVAVAGREETRIMMGDRTITIGPLNDCRGVLLSPDGQWLLTIRHNRGGVQLWSLPDGVKVPNFPMELFNARFSPDGKWLVASSQGTSRIWEVGSWREVRQIEGSFQNFSPDGLLGIVLENGAILKLFEIGTGRILARLERPDQQPLDWITFSPDGSRLVGTSNDPPSTKVIDLRAIRRGLAKLDLDWEAPAFSEDDPASTDLPPLPAIRVDYGFLGPDALFVKLERGVADLETTLAADPSNSKVRTLLANSCNNLAWVLATKFPSSSNLDRALTLSLRAIELGPGMQESLNTRGVVLYRAGQYAEAVSTLEKSLIARRGQFDAFDLFFLAMAHHRLGHSVEARRCLDRAIEWVSRQTSLRADYVKELASFRAEAEAVLAKELPDNVFEEPMTKSNNSPR